MKFSIRFEMHPSNLNHPLNSMYNKAVDNNHVFNFSDIYCKKYAYSPVITYMSPYHIQQELLGFKEQFPFNTSGMTQYQINILLEMNRYLDSQIKNWANYRFNEMLNGFHKYETIILVDKVINGLHLLDVMKTINGHIMILRIEEDLNQNVTDLLYPIKLNYKITNLGLQLSLIEHSKSIKNTRTEYKPSPALTIGIDDKSFNARMYKIYIEKKQFFDSKRKLSKDNLEKKCQLFAQKFVDDLFVNIESKIENVINLGHPDMILCKHQDDILSSITDDSEIQLTDDNRKNIFIDKLRIILFQKEHIFNYNTLIKIRFEVVHLTDAFAITLRFDS